MNKAVRLSFFQLKSFKNSFKFLIEDNPLLTQNQKTFAVMGFRMSDLQRDSEISLEKKR
jgi:hypothetical protein